VDRRTGVALLEVMVSLALLAGALVALAGLFGIAARTNRDARVVARMSVAAEQKMEQLRSLSWAWGADGEDQADYSTDVSSVPEMAGGPGLRPSPPGVLSADVPMYVDYLDDHGTWIGSGAGPPATSVFTRRWSVEPLADSPLDSLVLRVLVVRTATARAGPPAEGNGQTISLTTVRTRRSR
jgi:hypothetical protein